MTLTPWSSGSVERKPLQSPYEKCNPHRSTKAVGNMRTTRDFIVGCVPSVARIEAVIWGNALFVTE